MAGGSSRLGVFNDDDDFATALWSFPSETPEAPGFPLFASDADVSERLLGLHHHAGQLNCAPEINGGYTMAPETSMASEVAANDGLVDNPLAFGRDDSPLQIFLPTKPDASAQSGFINQADMSNGILRSDDWISLRLGDSAGGNHGEATSANGLNSSQQMSTGEGSFDTTTETASLLLGMNDNKAKRQRSDKPFSFPRQKRSNNQLDHQTAYQS